MGQEFAYSKGAVNRWFSVQPQWAGTKSAGGTFQPCSGIRESRRERNKQQLAPSLELSQGRSLIVLYTDFSAYLQVSCSLVGQFNWQLLLILSTIIATSTWWHSLSLAANSHPLMPPELIELAIHDNHQFNLKVTVSCHNCSLVCFHWNISLCVPNSWVHFSCVGSWDTYQTEAFNSGSPITKNMSTETHPPGTELSPRTLY